MSSTQIPNLNTFRRGAGRAKPKEDWQNRESIRKSNDQIIQETDHDAASSRLSAVSAGYLDDPFAALLTSAPQRQRLPLMNRGTYVRTSGIDKIVDTFLRSQPGRKQIVSIGAGSDTRYFRLMREDISRDLIYHELDFEANARSKIERIKAANFKRLTSELCSIDVDAFRVTGASLMSRNYYVHPLDLRHLPDTLPGVELDLATLIISECCLIYLPPVEADAVVRYFSEMMSAAPLAFVIYEPIRPHDPFGKTMVRNLISRGIVLQTFERYADLDLQRERLASYRCHGRAEDTSTVWRHWIQDAEKERVDRLEWMDEIEEFELLAQHYCIAWGWREWSNDSEWRKLSSSS